MNLFKLGKYTIKDLTKPARKIKSLNDHIQAAVDWLCLAQDINNNGGISLRYSLIKGWEASYPETTGYIIPTFIEYADLTQNEVYRQRAFRMADWEISIQKKDGSFNGGPLWGGYNSFVFDTGQIIFGLIAAHRITGEEKYINGAVKAGDWLIQVQDMRGMWNKFTFNLIPHVYYSRVAWALAELGVYTGKRVYSAASSLNIDWVLTKQHNNGWFDCAGFTEQTHVAPYTHTIAYTIRGILESGVCLNNKDYINSAKVSGESLVKIIRPDGSYYGNYDQHWNSNSRYSCLTGNAQIAIILLRLYEIFGKESYFKTAQAINRFLCRCQVLDGNGVTRGAISGSYPIWGRYQRYAFPNWAAKFFIDALLLEKKITNETGKGFKENLFTSEEGLSSVLKTQRKGN